MLIKTGDEKKKIISDIATMQLIFQAAARSKDPDALDVIINFGPAVAELLYIVSLDLPFNARAEKIHNTILESFKVLKEAGVSMDVDFSVLDPEEVIN